MARVACGALCLSGFTSYLLRTACPIQPAFRHQFMFIPRAPRRPGARHGDNRARGGRRQPRPGLGQPHSPGGAGRCYPHHSSRYANQPVGFSREQTNFLGRYKALERIQRGLPGRIHDNLLISDHLLIQWRCCPTVDPVLALNRPDFLTHLCLLFTWQLTLH